MTPKLPKKYRLLEIAETLKEARTNTAAHSTVACIFSHSFEFI